MCRALELHGPGHSIGLYTLPLLAAMAVALEVVPGLVLLRGPRAAGQPTA